MRIRAQFIITMLLFGAILAVIAVSAIITNRKLERAGQQENLAANIAQGASELSYLANDYLIYRESQQLKRWQVRLASFSAQVAGLNVEKPEQQVLVRNIRANEQRLKQVFDSVASAAGGPSRNRSTTPDLAFLQVSWSRMAVQSQGLASDASRLSQLLHQQMNRLTEARTALMYVMVGLFGAFLLISYMLTYRRILKSLARIQAGAAVIGSGNLDFLIEEKRNDEIGDLSQAINRMTTDLKAVTASKTDLEREIAQRQQMEEELRSQREWLRVTLSSIGDAVIAGDTEGRITFLNPVAAALTGWPAEEALGRPIRSVFRIINEKTQTPAEDLVGRVLEEKRVVGLANDTALVARDGREVPIEDSAAPILDAAGNLIGAVLVFHDVSEKRRARAELLEAHERAVWLARFPEQNPSPVLRVAVEGSILYCNPASAKLPGWACEVDQPLADGLLPVVRQALMEGQEVQQDVQLAGKIYWVSVAPFPEERYANVYGRDITERKQAEDAIKESEEKYRSLFSNMSEGFGLHEIILDAEGKPCDYRFLELNDAFEKLTGISRAKALGRTVREVLPDIESHWIEAYGRVALSGEPVRYENYSAPLGRWYEVYSYSPKKNQFAVVFIDTTERKRAEEALRNAYDELEKRVQERTFELSDTVERLQAEIGRCQRLEVTLREAENQVRFFASQCLTAQEAERKRVAGELHDGIAASLGAVKFRIEKVVGEMNQGLRRPESLEDLVSTITQINHEVRRIMSDLRPSILDDLGIIAAMNWFCREFEKAYSHIAVEKHMGIAEHEVPESLKTPIFRIVQEAMNNTAKHTQASMVRVDLHRSDGKIELAIRDNGQGFDPDTAGRGLGLSTMKERAQLSGGSFDLSSIIGKGTLIRVSWPLEGGHYPAGTKFLEK